MVIVTVLYQKRLEDAEVIVSVEKTAEQSGVVFDMIVFDNSPNINPKKMQSGFVDYEYYDNQQNVGVSECYNKAVAIAIGKGKKWVLITDSDFSFGIDLITAYYNAIGEFPDCKLFSPILVCSNKIISPYKKVFHRYNIFKKVNPGIYGSKGISIINNGMLCAPEVFSKTGGYCPAVMLDFSDDWFVSRYLQYYSSFVIIDFQIHHRLSSFEKHSFISVIQRFRMYCDGAYQMSKLYLDGYWYCIWSLFRAIRLGFRYRNFGFLKIFVNTFFRGKKI